MAINKNYNNSLKSVSFMLHSDHGFQQVHLKKFLKKHIT